MQKDGKPQAEASIPQKRVRVLDEAGNEYEATYPKRAKGLVKHGRARFTDESQTAIILTCPPNQHMILEDNTMNEQIKNIEVTESAAVETPATETPATETTVNEAAPALTSKEVFDQIVALQNLITNENTNPLYSLSDAIGFICRDTMWTSDELRCGAVNAASTPYRMREETYQKMLAVYQQMYNDLKPQNEAKYAERREFMNWVRDCIDATQCGQDLPDFERLWNIFN